MTKCCKSCGLFKEYNYLCLNTQNRSTYKDEHGKLWHSSKQCGACHSEYVKLAAKKPPLTTKSCEACQKVFKQKNSVQLYCCKLCRVQGSAKMSV